MISSALHTELKAYRAAQVASLAAGQKAALIEGQKAALFERLRALCLEAYGGQDQAPALFAAICRGPRDNEAAGGEWSGDETPITDTDGRRVQALWLAATGRAASMMDGYRAMGYEYGA